MHIQLSDHFTLPKLLRFVAPSIVMMVFTSIYSVVDGLFVSNFVGKVPFAAINLISPLLMALGALGFMLGTGGTAIVAKTLGEGEAAQANRYFSMLVYTGAVCGAVLTVLGQLFLLPAAGLLGAKGEALRYCVLYGRITLCVLPCFMLQCMFQSLFVTAEKSHLGLAVTVAAGLSNMALDALFVAVFRWGLAGAALATALSQCVGGLVPVLYFARPNTSLLRLGPTRFYGRVLLKACTNGSSELMNNIAASVVAMLYNFQLLRFAGEDGVAAYGVIMYVSFLFAAVFFGYAMGVSPPVSYHYGAGNLAELRNLRRKSLWLLGAAGTVMAAVSFALSPVLARFFVGYDAGLLALTVHGMRIFSLGFAPAGINIFGSAFFTALNNGPVSAVISFLRTLVFQVIVIAVLPALFELEGIWVSIVAAEVLSLGLTSFFLITQQKNYQY